MEANSGSSSYCCLHIAMYPWLAMGHITPFLQLSNKLARKGHRISFIVPTKTVSKLQHQNRFPNLIAFVPIAVPHVQGLPPGAETTNDVAAALFPLIATAMDHTERHVEALLLGLNPDLVFFDFAYWVPKLGRSMGFKTIYFSIISPAFVAYATSPAAAVPPEQRVQEPLPGFRDTSVRLRRHELSYLVKTESEAFGSGLKLGERHGSGVSECDAIAWKGCREIDGPFVDLLTERLGWDISLVGPILPEEPAAGPVDPSEWDGFLSSFEPGSVVFICLGTEQRLSRDQFQELVLGLELAGSPFLAVVRPPCGAGSVEEALPEGFLERVGKRGAVHGGWVRQQVILAHPSVGCFVTHCGAGSMTEALGNRCQIVMILHKGDHFFQARVIGNSLKAGVEVERDEHNNGWFGRESVCKAIRTVMDKDQSNLVGTEIRNNCAELHKLFQNKDLEAAYIDRFIHKLHTLVLG